MNIAPDIHRYASFIEAPHKYSLLYSEKRTAVEERPSRISLGKYEMAL